MYRENFDYEKISRAIDSAFRELQTQEVIDHQVMDEWKEAETNLQQALQHMLSTKLGGFRN